ncbi:glycoside hydrolase family 3 C-terminal domain-containing protein, partial [Klebsiella pneumoniae]|uniref:glycoside hydrolase family 3 C-terminal domain-containing protein n=1 Tax=Klebsiella pneumoniae TaxID=573 RepID=UPI00200CB4E4
QLTREPQATMEGLQQYAMFVRGPNARLVTTFTLCATRRLLALVLLCLGLDEIKESEGLDRADMKLADNQIELLQAVQQANPNTVVVLSAGASLETPWLTHCKALVYGALGGQAGAG